MIFEATLTNKSQVVIYFVRTEEFPKDILKIPPIHRKYLLLEEVYLLLLLIELFLSKVGKHTMQTHQKIILPLYGNILAKNIAKKNGEKMWRGYITNSANTPEIPTLRVSLPTFNADRIIFK